MQGRIIIRPAMIGLEQLLPKSANFVKLDLSFIFSITRNMGLPGHRRTSSHKRRRASHFALKAATIVKDKKSGLYHLSHRAAPGAKEYRGHAIHVKGAEKKLEKLLKKTRSAEVAEKKK
jgi:ribosomal protein L32